ncbi:MAG: Crp/Fnr family transcriptional regulator [Sphingomonas bacterium]|uniref:Crp/Fnr family transcriptional regulator n=1 Tax=Sphingomonas bacterium TaxID=1895847 RepID=UPI0026052FD0|nr:Crp/Fnr family transcriptional regulator [Sphingomonas bacterium]MDB5711745.1 Crp/Fnr family transcriptional regulator [Sphingomonas bacterium]
MHRQDQSLSLLADKLGLWLPLDGDHRAAIVSLPHVVRTLRAGEFIVREEDRPRHSCLLLSGFAARHKLAGNGARQILALHIASDLIDMHQAMPTRADHNIQALSTVTLAYVPLDAIRDLGARQPAVGEAMWFETLVEAATLREWMLNIGRRDARTRTAHLLCEMGVRLHAAGLGERDQFTLPFTQEQMADALALTNVHVSRMLALLAAEGLIERHNRHLTILDFARLATVGDFDPRYLHLERYGEVAG